MARNYDKYRSINFAYTLMTNHTSFCRTNDSKALIVFINAAEMQNLKTMQ